jgi:hypothetical protein
MIAQSQVIAGGILLIICQTSPAVARGGSAVGADQPWNPAHIDQLPAEVRNAAMQLCGASLRAGHYFATYSENSRFLNLHFELSHCPSQVVCKQAGCLHQIYILTKGRYRLLRSYYGSAND